MVSLILLSVASGFIYVPFRRWAAYLMEKERQIRAVLDPQVEKIKKESQGHLRHERISKLFHRYSYHPILGMRSALGIVFQVPFIFVAYHMLAGLTEIKGVELGMISDLSRPDALMAGVNILPLLMTLINFIATATTPKITKKDSMQAYGVAIVFLVFLYSAPAALMIFWTCNNLISLLQNFIPVKNKMNSRRDSKQSLYYWRDFEVAFLFPLVVFLLIPGHAYFTNRTDLNNQHVMFLAVACFFIPTSILIWLILSFIRKWYGEVKVTLAKFLFFALGLIILINDFWIPVQLGRLDGTPTIGAHSTLFSWFELLLAMAALFVVFRLKLNREVWAGWITRLVAVFSLLLLLFSIGVKPLPARSKESSTEAFNRKLPNIYILHLDAAQVDFSKRVILDQKWQDSFSGFDFFENNISNFPYTVESVISYLIGKYPKLKTVEEWKSLLNDSILSDFKKIGYRLSYYGNPGIYPTQCFHRKVTLTELVSKYPMFIPYVQVWFARIMPNAFTEFAFQKGKRVGEFLMAKLLDQDVKLIPTTIEEGIEPYSGVLVLNKVREEEISRNSGGEVVYVRADIPHSPWIFNQDCTFKKGEATPGTPAERYYRQSVCGLRLVKQFLETLKSLNRYDSSIIVVMGDHGEGWAGQLVKPDSLLSTLETESSKSYDPKIHPWTKVHLEGRARALLMVKRPKAENELQSHGILFEQYPTHHVDIAPTILGMLGSTGIERKFDGIDIYDSRPKKRRRFFHYFEIGFPGSHLHHVFEPKLFEPHSPMSLDEVFN